jgi:TP53 regulating kinase-like protein
MTAEIWAIGAESEIYRVKQWGIMMVLKKRLPKPYLLEAIDESLRRLRTGRECRMLAYARRLGVRVPTVYAVDVVDHTIAMDFISGKQLKQLAGEISEASLKKLCREFGRLVGLLHRGSVVHGDPTTSNVIVDDQSRLWLVDFGLGEYNATVEMKGVDLHLIRRALETTHWEHMESMLDSTIEGYVSLRADDTEDCLLRMNEIRERGRYH